MGQHSADGLDAVVQPTAGRPAAVEALVAAVYAWIDHGTSGLSLIAVAEQHRDTIRPRRQVTSPRPWPEWGTEDDDFQALPGCTEPLGRAA
jgi:hypothetical protein